MAEGIFTSVADFIRERLPEAKMLRGEIAAAELPPVQMSAADARAMGYEDLNALREARLASGQMGDAEFEIASRNRMGPIGASSIDASRYKTLFTTPQNLKGTYYDPGVPPEARRAREAERGLDKVFQESGMEGGDPDMVYALSAINANPRLQAHEFRHRAGYGERDTQLLDAWRARTPEEWRNSVRRWKDYYEVYGGSESDAYQSYSEAEEALLEELQDKREMILDLEANWIEGSEDPANTLALEFNRSVRRKHHYAKLATLDESEKAKYRQDFGLGQDFDVPTEEQNEARARNLENLSNQADARARMTGRTTAPVERADGGGIAANGIVEYLKNVGRGHDPAWRRELLEDASNEELPASLREDMYESAMPPPPSAAQALWGTGLITGVGGIAEAGGVYPEPPAHGTSIYEMLTGPRTPSVKEHWQTGHPWIAGLQTLGAVVPTAAYVKAASGPIRRGIASLRGADDLPEGVAAQLADLPDDASRREFLKNLGLTAAGIAALGVGIGRGVRPASTAARVASRALPSSRPNIAGFHKLFSGLVNTKAPPWYLLENSNVSQWERLRALRHIDVSEYDDLGDIVDPSRWMSRNLDEGVDWAGMSERYGLGPDDFHILDVNTEIAVPSIPSNTSVYSPELNTSIYEDLFGRIDTASIHLRPTNPVPDLVKPSHVQDFMEEVRGGALHVDRFPRILDDGKVAIDEVMGVPVVRGKAMGNAAGQRSWLGGDHQLMIPTEQGLRKLELHRLKQGVGDRLAPETLQRLEGPAGYNTTARDMGEPLGTLRLPPEQVRDYGTLRGYESRGHSFSESADVARRSVLPLEVTRPSDRVGFTGVGPTRSLPTGPTTSGLNPESLREMDALREFYDLPLAKKGGGGITASRRIQRFQEGGGVDLGRSSDDYSFLDRALDTPLGPGSPNTLRDVPAMARSLGPGFLEIARYQPTGAGDVAEAAHFASSLRDPEYRRELVDLPEVSYRGPHSLPFNLSDLNAPQWDALATLLPGGAAVSKGVGSLVAMTSRGGDDLEKMMRRLADIRRRSAEKPPISREQELLETELDQNLQRQKELRALMEDSTAAWTRPMREELSTLVNRQGQLDQELRGFSAIVPKVQRFENKNWDLQYKDNSGEFWRAERSEGAVGEGLQLGAIGSGVYLAPDARALGTSHDIAKAHLDTHLGGEGTLVKYRVREGLKMADADGPDVIAIKKEMGFEPWQYGDDPMYSNWMTAQLKKKGYDGVISTDPFTGMVIFDESNIVPVVQKRDGGAIMSSMSRGITGLSRPAGHGPLHVPRGTLPMQEGGAVGPRQGGGMFLYPAGPAPYFNAADYFLPAGEVPAATQPRSLFGSVYTPQVPASSLSFVPSETGKEDTTSQAAWSVSPGTAMLDESRNVNDPTWITSTGGASGSEPMGAGLGPLVGSTVPFKERVTGVTEGAKKLGGYLADKYADFKSPLKEIDTSHLEKKLFIEQNPQEYGTSLTEVGPPAPDKDSVFSKATGYISDKIADYRNPLKEIDVSKIAKQKPPLLPVGPPAPSVPAPVSQWSSGGPGADPGGMGWSAPSMATTGAASRMRFNVDQRPDESGHNYEVQKDMNMVRRAVKARADELGITVSELEKSDGFNPWSIQTAYENQLEDQEIARQLAAKNSYAQGGDVQHFQEGMGVRPLVVPSEAFDEEPPLQDEGARFWRDAEGMPVVPEGMPMAPEEPGLFDIASEGFWNVQDRPGINLRDVTNVIFDPSSKLDMALLPLLVFPPAKIAASLVKWGFQGWKLTRAMQRAEELQKILPKSALGNPGDAPINVMSPSTWLGKSTSGPRSYMQGNMATDVATLPVELFDRDPNEIEDFFTPTQRSMGGGITSLSIGR